MKVEEHVDARHRRCFEVLEQLGRFCKHALRAAHVDVDSLQPFRHSPLKYSPPTPAAGFEACLAHDCEDARLLAGLDDDEGKARSEQHFKLTARILRHG